MYEVKKTPMYQTKDDLFRRARKVEKEFKEELPKLLAEGFDDATSAKFLKRYCEDDAIAMDWETIHEMADYMLCEVLEHLEFRRLVIAWDLIPKWYA